MPVKYKLGTGDTIDILAITKTNQGSGSGLDSDLLDGLEGAAYEKIANKGVASGYASLNASSLVVQNPTSKGLPNGLAELDSGGKVPSSQLPGLALTDVWTVASESEQLALTAQEGDIAIRTDLNKSYAHNGGTAGTMADWSLLLTPTDAILSVFGRTGAVVAQANDYTWALIDKTISSLADITTRSHTLLSDIGSNTHAQIDTHLGASSPHAGHEVIANKDQANGYPGLSAGSLILGTQLPYGVLVNTVCQGNDSRLSDARTPTAHASTHERGGSDIAKASRLYSGLDASKPGTGNTEGDVWWATDTDKLYVWDGLAWKEMAGSGATTFLGLTDTPSAYTGQAKKLVRVNAGATALEFLNELDNLLVGGLEIDTSGYILTPNIKTSSRLRATTTNHTFEDRFVKDVVGVTSWATIRTIAPSTITNIYTMGVVYLKAMGYTVSQGNGLRLSKWNFAIYNATPTVAVIGTDETSGFAPQCRLILSGNNILVQVQSNDGTNTFEGMAIVEISCPRDYNSAATYTIS